MLFSFPCLFLLHLPLWLDYSGASLFQPHSGTWAHTRKHFDPQIILVKSLRSCRADCYVLCSKTGWLQPSSPWLQSSYAPGFDCIKNYWCSPKECANLTFFTVSFFSPSCLNFPSQSFSLFNFPAWKAIIHKHIAIFWYWAA